LAFNVQRLAFGGERRVGETAPGGFEDEDDDEYEDDGLAGVGVV
jgi:hypothetical protein